MGKQGDEVKAIEIELDEETEVMLQQIRKVYGKETNRRVIQLALSVLKTGKPSE